MTGCIPVFVGPPFHTMPLTHQVDYSSFALFFNITESASWNVNETVQWELSMEKRGGANDAHFWIPDMPDIAAHLIAMPTLLVRP
jgi:hypothetical protein